MKRILALVLAAMMLLSMAACAASSPAATESTASESAEPSEAVTGVEDGVLTVGMECAYAPYNWTQMDDSNGAVPISNVPGAYANGYDVMIAQKICDANGETTKYANEAAKYNSYYQGYFNAYNQAYMPKQYATHFKL